MATAAADDKPKGLEALSKTIAVDSESSSEQSSPSGPSTPPDTLEYDGPVGPKPFYPRSLFTMSAAGEQLASPAHAPPQPPALPAIYPQLPSYEPISSVGDKEKGTPDDWIPREDAMVRLTGRWPFNSEAPLPLLKEAGFLTPPPLFYVRNHGVVPRVTQAEALAWTFTVCGLVEHELELSLADLQSQFEVVTLPITLVCAGNRRKEQNMVRKSLGFSWGAAGLSTALFTGVYLSDILARAKPRNEGSWGPEGWIGRRAAHVIFEGAEDLPDGKYGTSQLLRWCEDKGKGMMLAWAMNGEPLEPDHGYPLRLVVPGQIGGRSVKWLKKVEVSDIESQHHLHFWDNKVLPTTLMPEQARAERHWWYDPKYIITDLNTNSAMWRPAHNEELVVEKQPDGEQKESGEASDEPTYELSGYAYSGGGRRVARVEVSLNEGVEWKLCEVEYPEDLFRRVPFEADVWGKLDITQRDECFCWCFWKIKVPVSAIANTGCLAVRGMDSALNPQPANMYWNPTGMMNSWWFRVAVHKTVNDDGSSTLRFEHPTMPGTQSGGWMERMKDAGLDPSQPVFTKISAEDLEIKELSKEAAVKPQIVMTKAGINRKITLDELKAHNKESEPWFVVNGEVYDGTGFLDKHPGGAESITLVAGEDASEDFMAIHSPDAKNQLRDYHIGTLVQDGAQADAAPAESTEPDAVFLQKNKWKKAKLISIDRVNHDARIYRFELEYPEQPFGLPTGQHVYARLRRKTGAADQEATGGIVVQGELVQRAYTPISPESALGHVDLLIKVYHRTADFPDGGKMTLGFEELEWGDTIEFKGPLGTFQWLGNSTASWRSNKLPARNVGLIAGGSGITPIYQVLRAISNDTSDRETRIWLVNANKTETDILLRHELEAFAHRLGVDRFRSHYILSKPPAEWLQGKGRINLKVMQEHMPPPNEDSLILICGPDPMIEHSVKPTLKELGWDIEKQLVVF